MFDFSKYVCIIASKLVAATKSFGEKPNQIPKDTATVLGYFVKVKESE